MGDFVGQNFGALRELRSVSLLRETRVLAVAT